MLAGRLGEARRLARVFLPFGERVGEAWAVGTLRAVEAYAAAELGELAEADREARRAYRDFAAASDDWGRGFALVVRGAVARGLAEPRHAVDLLTDALAYAEKTGHPLLVGMARTVRGFVLLEEGDAVAAEADARAVLAVVEPHDVLDTAQVAPRVLLAQARRAAGDLDAAVHLIGEVADLVDAGRTAEALDLARLAVDTPAEDVRSRVTACRVLARALYASGRCAEATEVARAAVREAYATQQMSERAAAQAVLTEVGC